MKSLLEKVLPTSLVDVARLRWRAMRRQRIRLYHRVAGLLGLRIAKVQDYYSVQPVLEHLYKNRHRWDKPSELSGIEYDLKAMQQLMDELVTNHGSDVLAPNKYLEQADSGYGLGYPRLDAILSYCLLRELKPARYLEVGSGLSTQFAWLAGQENTREGHPMEIRCIEPHPTDLLRSMNGVELITDEVQNIPVQEFEFVQSGDVLFIDSTHALRVDSDVAYLFMEIIPRVAIGTWIHVHDVPFPYNTPFPADTWIVGARWPVFWQEAMVLQAFLSHNRAFEIRMSVPLLRHFEESFIEQRIPDYLPVKLDPNPPSAIWIERTN